MLEPAQQGVFFQMIYPDMPEFHDEYKNVYKENTEEYEILKEAYLHVKYTPTQVNSLNNTFYDETALIERYGPVYKDDSEITKNKMMRFMFAAKPGDILKDYLPGKPPEKDTYHCIKGIGQLKQLHENGKTYVSVAMVDNSQLLFGQFQEWKPVSKDKIDEKDVLNENEIKLEIKEKGEEEKEGDDAESKTEKDDESFITADEFDQISREPVKFVGLS